VRIAWKSAIAGLAVILALVFGYGALSQEPPAPPPTTSAPSAEPAVPPAKPGKEKYHHANDFVIRGSVFNEKGLSFPGAQLRIRRSSEKKFRWESYTASLGDFAVRVPQGYEYELVVHAKGFTDQTRMVDAKNGGDEERMVFRMEPVAGGKK